MRPTRDLILDPGSIPLSSHKAYGLHQEPNLSCRRKSGVQPIFTSAQHVLFWFLGVHTRNQGTHNPPELMIFFLLTPVRSDTTCPNTASRLSTSSVCRIMPNHGTLNPAQARLLIPLGRRVLIPKHCAHSPKLA